MAAILGISIGIAQFYSEEFCASCRPFSPKIVSVSAGISIAYIFLILFPEYLNHAKEDSELLSTSILAGFVVFHLIEKYIYQRSPVNHITSRLAIEDTTISFLYHIILGIIILNFTSEQLTEGVLFFIPIILYTALSTLPIQQTQNKKALIFLSSATILGVIIGEIFADNINHPLYASLIGFVLGVMIFTVTRHSIPFGKEGKPLYFLIGVIAYTVLIIII